MTELCLQQGPIVRLMLVLLIAFLALSADARAEPYNAMYVFGDSYSDIGARLRDSDGLTAVAYLAKQMGIEMTYPQDPERAGKSLNFAASAATTGREAPHVVNGSTWCCQGMLDQVEDFARRVRDGSVSFNTDSTLFFIAGGLNDRTIPTEQTIKNLTEQIRLLKEVGAYHVRLALLPRRIPYFSELSARLNPAYRRLVSDLGTKLGLDLRTNNWGLYFDEVITAKDRYGIVNTVDACAGPLFKNDMQPCDTPERYYYYHDAHPSAAVHQAVANLMYREIVDRNRSWPYQIIAVLFHEQ